MSRELGLHCLNKVVTIGRKSTCDVVIDSLNISSVHCKVKISPSSELEVARITVNDCSRNGTWVERRDAHTHSTQKPEKLVNGEPKIIRPGDMIMLLAPGHKENAKYRYKLVIRDGKYFLQHPSPEKRDGVKRKSELEAESSVPIKKARPILKPTKMLPDGDKSSEFRPILLPALKPTTNLSDDGNYSSELKDAEDLGRCPLCRKYFVLSYLPIHCPMCQEAGKLNARLCSDPDAANSMEECPRCKEIFTVEKLVGHLEVCEDDDIKRNPDLYGECPHCSVVLPVMDLIKHSTVCDGGSRLFGAPSSSTSAAAHCSNSMDVEIDGSRKLLSIEHCKPASPLPFSTVRSDGRNEGGATQELGSESSTSELEQCAYCLEEFPLCQIITHYSVCTSKPKSDEEELCQYCLKVFPLDELILHVANCSEGKKEEQLEKCMHCLKDFPLSELVVHSNRCTGDVLGARDRFKHFVPSVHDLDSPVVLTEAQSRALEYVTQKSKRDSEALYQKLKKRVVGLGSEYSEEDLRKTLQWIRSDAPIIIHLDLKKSLQFLMKDTHYRNLFEVGRGGGGNDTVSRRIWEDRIFNNFYKNSPALERVKYGVLNIVGDPRGVQACSGYGDSFIQLKKVRLRTTFASADTSKSTVKLSCCEHYGNVLFEYNDMELKAIIDVATRRKSFLKSAVISVYKEVQVHGPVSLSDNVDCVVANQHHKSSPGMVRMLEEFVEKNKCNLIWMEHVDYPMFDMTVPKKGRKRNYY